MLFVGELEEGESKTKEKILQMNINILPVY